MKTSALILAACGLLTGCSLQSNSYVETLKLATVGAPDVEVSSQQVAQIPYASAYLTVGELPRAFVVLAFEEQDQLKWISADRNLFVYEQGRLIKTLGLDNDLRWMSERSHDPLRTSLTVPASGQHWVYTAEWSKDDESGHQLDATMFRRGIESRKVLGQSMDLIHLEEQVRDRQTGERWSNHFWVEPHSGDVLASRQQLGPQTPTIEFSLLKPS
jgi:hypothetical protein